MISNSSVTIHDWDSRTEVLAVEKLLCIKAGWDLQLWHETSHQPATTDSSSSGWHLKYPTDVIWIPNSTYLSLSVLDELIALHDLKCHLSSISKSLSRFCLVDIFCLFHSSFATSLRFRSTSGWQLSVTVTLKRRKDHWKWWPRLVA